MPEGWDRRIVLCFSSKLQKLHHHRRAYSPRPEFEAARIKKNDALVFKVL